ncbi:MAG: arginase family protein [Candidatus Baldrarchaeota archaeon]
MSTHDLHLLNVKDTLRLLIEELNSRVEKAYLSIDLDVLDPSYTLGVGNPEPSGISTRQLIETYFMKLVR